MWVLEIRDNISVSLWLVWDIWDPCYQGNNPVASVSMREASMLLVAARNI
jgi:hypothetical protein